MGTSNNKRRIARRRRLWAEDPCCRLCGVKTVLPENIPPQVKGLAASVRDSMATLDHIFPRFHPRRLTANSFARERTRLLCLGCNNKLGRMQSDPAFCATQDVFDAPELKIQMDTLQERA